jgi:DUF4097 and DUF4098 domain-containing protein YvlB
MRTREISALIPLCLTAAVLLTPGCATVADDYRIPDGATQSRGYTSVAGDIEVGRRATIGKARTVSGDIEIGEGSRTDNLTTVAGKVRLAPNVKVAGSIKTVAGDVEIAKGCAITGDISTVVGRITLTDSTVGRGVTLASGALEVTRSDISGAVRVRYSDNKNAEVAEVTIGPGSVVAELVVEENAKARVKIHRTAKVKSVQGVEAEYYD